MVKKGEVIYNKYTCQYCNYHFKARSGHWGMKDKKLVILKNTIKCNRCGNFLKNRGEE